MKQEKPSGTIAAMHKRLTHSVALLLALVLGMSSCSFPFLKSSEEESLEATQTSLASFQTAIVLTSQEALLTQAAQVLPGDTATPPPVPTLTEPPTAIPTIVRTPTLDLSGLVTMTPMGMCNAASAGQPFDITIPDGSMVLPGQRFEKVWRLVNSGTCTWTRLYKLVFYSQNPMGAYQEQLFGGEVQPGQAVDLKVQFVAPLEPGEYQSNWMLMDADQNLFGVGTWADSPFWVAITVVEELPADATPVN